MKLKNKKRLSRVFLVLVSFLLVFGVWNFIFDIKLEIKPSNKFLTLLGQKIKRTPEEITPEYLSSLVVPAEGYSIDVNWGDIGKKLVESGGIDMDKYGEVYVDPKYKDLLDYLNTDSKSSIKIDSDSAYFWVNTLWAFGLTQKSDVLEKGVMGTQYKDTLGNFASTGGWTLGARDAVSLYSSAEIISLNADQQQLVTKISSGIYRPCCGNPTSFPDCNHGMAILGLIELMVGQGFGEEEIYKAALAFNSYWFSQTYMDLAYYFETKEGVSWDGVDPKLVLSAQYSSAPGYRTIKKQIGNIPGLPESGASCGT